MKMHGVALMRLLSLAMAVLASAAAVATENGPNRRPSAAPAANPGACYTIANPDMRNLCRARAASDASTCYTITDADLRAYCRALISGDSRR